MSSRRPQDLVFTLFGEYLSHRNDPVWVGSLIALLRPFRVSEGAVRTVLSRMSRKRWLAARRVGRNAYYSLTARGSKVVEEGEARIFHPPQDASWEGRWCLVTYSIPEDVRQLRDRLRVRLAWLGFGSLGNGVWVSPHDVHHEVADMATDMGLEDGHLVCFSAQQIGNGGPQELVDRCWDLPALAQRYRNFLHRWEAKADEVVRSLGEGTLPDDRAFVLRFQLIHEYRAFPMEDPFLPPALLPVDWPGRDAAQVFNACHRLLKAPSDRYVESVLSEEPLFRGQPRPTPA